MQSATQLKAASFRSSGFRGLSSRRPAVACFAEVKARWCLDLKFGRKAEGTALLQEWVRDVGGPAGLSPHNTRLSSGFIGAPESRLELEVTFPSISELESFLGAVSAKEHKAWSQRIQMMVVDGSPTWQVYKSVPLELEDDEPQQQQRQPQQQQQQWQQVLEPVTSTPSTIHSRQPPQQQPRLSPPDQEWQLVNVQQQQQQQQQGEGAMSSEELEFEQLIREALDSKRKGPDEQASSPPSSQARQLPSGEVGGTLEQMLRQEGVLDVPKDGDVVLDWKGDPMIIKPGDRMPKWF